MARRKVNNEIQGQLTLPEEIVKQFTLPTYWRGRNREVEPGYLPVTILPTYQADGRGIPKYRPVRYDDWIKEQTKPWRREPDRDIAWLLARHKGSDKFAYETVPEEVTK